MKKYKKIIIIYLLFMFSLSCVEHKFFLNIHPDGNYYFEYNGHGDRDDLINFDFPMPDNSKWNIISTINENLDAETFDYRAYKLSDKNENFPITFFNSDSIPFQALLKHPMEINHFNLFFLETYHFKWTFENRDVNKKYPLVSNLIQNPENPPVGWVRQTLDYLLNETLNQSNIGWNTRPIIKSSLDDWIKSIQELPDSIILNEYDYYKQAGLDVIMQPVQPNLYFDMDSIFQTLEYELEITLELMDDDFNHYTILPGEIKFSNSDTLISDTLFWNFGIENFMNEDYTMIAKSKIIYNNRKIGGLIFLMVCFLLIASKKLNLI